MKLIAKYIALSLGLCWVGFVQAQIYICKDNTGRSYESPRVCPPRGLVIYGPTEKATPGGNTYQPGIGKAPEHIIYMSPRCGSLHDAIRTAAARGVKQPEVSQLQNEYDRDCSREESSVRQRINELNQEKNRDARSAEQAQQVAAQQSKMSAQLCGELKRVIKGKRLRTDLTPGELGDLERAEQNHKNRCT